MYHLYKKAITRHRLHHHNELESELEPQHMHRVFNVTHTKGEPSLTPQVSLAVSPQRLEYLGGLYEEILGEVVGQPNNNLIHTKCYKCDERIAKILDMSRILTSSMLEKQILFHPPAKNKAKGNFGTADIVKGDELTGGWSLQRKYNPFFKFLGTFQKAALQSCLKIGKKLQTLPKCRRS